MNSTPVAQELIESGLVERDLCEMIDALETGLLRLQRERNDLRDALQRAGTPVAKPKRSATRKNAKKTMQKAVKKAVKKKAAVKVGTPEPVAPELVAAPPKAPSKSRPALGRTLTMIRSPRTQNP